jgi:GNAT superfamily N-acetyltransferase
MSALTIEPVRSGRAEREFVRFPRDLYRWDPHFRALPDLIALDQIRKRSNPWFEHGEAQLFLARQKGEVVGRISAQVDREHLKVHADETGFFGFFDAISSETVMRELLQAAEEWCRARGMRRMRGPFSFSINELSGMLVEGFDSPNYLMMPHGQPYYPRALEGAGYQGAMDLYAWRYRRQHPSEQVQAIADAVASYPGLVVRPLNKRRMAEELDVIMSIFNEAWSKNWGFVPMTPREIAAVAKQFQRIADPELCLIAEVDGEPAAMAVALPNLHETVADLDGALFPTGWARLLYRLAFRPPTTFRQILLGVRKKFRGSVLGGLSLLLYVTIHRNAYQKGYREAEASWTLANNVRINQGMEFMGAEKYKTYRIYEREL